jgi:Family of unknown function (DUF6335)
VKTKARHPRSRDQKPGLPRTSAVQEASTPGAGLSPTAVAAEALRTGVLPPVARGGRISHADEALLVGDPDDDVMGNQYVGEETPGASTPTPDQNEVDEIGRAYGLQEEDNGALRSAEEVLERRDRHRVELQPPAKPTTD